MTKIIISLAMIAIGPAALAANLTCTTQAYGDPNGRITARIDSLVITHVDASLCHDHIDDCVGLGAEQVSGTPDGEDMDYSIGQDRDGYSFKLKLPVSALRAKTRTFTGQLESALYFDEEAATVGLDCSQN